MLTLPPFTDKYLKPLPEITDAGRPFWEGLARHELVIPKCSNCGDYNWVPYPACRTCLSEDQVWTPVSGDATLFSYSIVHRGPGAFQEDVPYVVALAELVEQPRPCIVLGTLVGVDHADIEVGMPLQIAFEDIPAEDVTMWHWTGR